MEKLTIAGRTNWKHGFYVKFKAEEKSMKVIKKIVETLGSEYFTDNQVIPRTFSDYTKWKDQWIPVITKNFRIDIICGDKIIHMVINECPKFELVNDVLDKYCVWAQPKYKKGFGPSDS